MAARSGLELQEPLVFERGSPGRRGVEFPCGEAPEADDLPESLRRSSPLPLPEVSELEAVRHFTRLSRMNYAVDLGMYPLGSCTMKYNPKVCEDMASLAGFAGLHPLAPDSLVQGALEVFVLLEAALAEISGMSAVSLLPAAGAHGEWTGIKVIRAALEARGNPRKKVLIPDTAHGTNPASSALHGYQVVPLKSSEDGVLDPGAVAAAMDEDTAAIMITNPNTLGLFERHLPEVARIVHERGGFVYGDGANLNALMGKVRPACLGIDVIQFNLHKTFSTPHGGGGPGSGPVGVVEVLAPFLPVPRVVRREDGTLALSEDFPQSIGRVRSFQGQFLVMVRALTYILALGGDGLKRVAERAVLNANYLRVRLQDHFHLPFPRTCMHEVVFSDKGHKKQGVETMDVAKRLIDKGFHPPTVYFPLNVHGALMVEPTETEDLGTLKEFVQAMTEIAEEIRQSPETLHHTPTLTAIQRPDEVTAARQPVLTWRPGPSQ